MKRKNKNPLPITIQEKKTKEELPKEQKQIYIFQIKKPHTQLIIQQNNNQIENIKWMQQEITQIKILPKVLISLKRYEDKVLYEHLDLLFQKEPCNEILVEESKVEGDDIEQNKICSEEMVGLKEELVFNLFEKKI